jgi:hypothetical protein
MKKLNQINYFTYSLVVYILAVLSVLTILIINSFELDRSSASSVPALNTQKIESMAKIFEEREEIDYQDFNYSGIQYGKNEPF